MSKLPFLKFYPADWLQDTQVLNLAGQGAWIKIICALHTSPTYGKREFTRDELSTFLNLSSDPELDFMLNQLTRVADIITRDEDGNVTDSWNCVQYVTIICRRMIREEGQRKQWVKDQSAHRQRNVRSMSAGRSQKSEVRSQIIVSKDTIVDAVETTVVNDTVSVKDLVDSWNECFNDKLPSVVWPLARSRQQKTAARLKEHRSLDFWQHVFDNIAHSDFLLGKNNGTWRCSFDFLITNDSNCIKIYEGVYNRDQSNSNNQREGR